MYLAAMASLQESAEKTVISSLGQIAGSFRCKFSCGGTVPQLNHVEVLYKKQLGSWLPLHLPADTMATGEENVSLQEFLDACSTASFGVGGKTVTDKAYRDALKLEPEDFHTDFELSNTTILSEITTIMSVGASSASVRAELYKMNVYLTGGHFKAHVDTPRSEGMFGSLVVCLPSVFTGGELVTRHLGHPVKFDWSSCATAVQWAAFFSDVYHEVHPVTSGHRISLTYNLYHVIPFQPQLFDVKINPLYQELITVSSTNSTVYEGGRDTGLLLSTQVHRNPYQID
jgi:hypothetical protein